MIICPIHIRLTISEGHKFPSDLEFFSMVIENETNLDEEKFEKRFEALNENHKENISPMKPSKSKAIPPNDINLAQMNNESKVELNKKLQGRRQEREIVIESFTNTEKSQPSFVDAVQTRRTKQESVSSTSSKDDVELSEILNVKTNSKQSTVRLLSDDHPRSVSPKTVKVPYFSGNPAVEITHGIIHLFKANSTIQVGQDHSLVATNVLCMLGVPADVDTHAILKFTAAYCDSILRLKIVRDRTPNEYKVLVTFTSDKMANKFFLDCNNKPFSSMFPEELCRLAFVASVEALSAHKERGSVSPLGLLPLPGATELPDCTVCLEKMDESVRGVLTILCNHSFHGSCLQQWEDLCCPVCRYVQTPEPKSDNTCQSCGSVEDLWICLVCGNVGCGRYTMEHAQQHYLDTHHNYAMALSDNRVWDYAGDYFVHRLFQNKEDGKLVEQKDCDGENYDGKFEAIQLECMYLLTSQLESQRKYWEGKLRQVETRAMKENEEIADKLREAVDRCNEIDRKYSEVEHSKSLLEKKVSHLSNKYSNSLKDLSTEQELNKSLRQNQQEWKEKVDELESKCSSQDNEIGELKEQIRDLMFYLEAQNTIGETNEEMKKDLQGGQIVVGESAKSKKKQRNKK